MDDDDCADVCCDVATPAFIERKSKMATRFSTLAQSSPSTFPIRTLISTNKIALKSTTDGQSMFFGLFQQLIEYQNARKTQLRFCLFRQRERRLFFSFPFNRFSRKGKMVMPSSHTHIRVCLEFGLPQPIAFCSRTHIFALSGQSDCDDDECNGVTV